MHYIKQMKHNSSFSFWFFPLPWEKVQREESKCRCTPTSTAVGDRHVGTTAYFKMTSGFSTHSQGALRSPPSQHLQDSCRPLLFICTIFTSCSNLLLRQTCYLPFCTSEHLSCTMSSLDNKDIKEWNSCSLLSGFWKVWRDVYTSISELVKNCWRWYKLERQFTKPKFWLSKFQRKNGLFQYILITA